MRLSTRNQLTGTIRAIDTGSVMTIVKVELDGGQHRFTTHPRTRPTFDRAMMLVSGRARKGNPPMIERMDNVGIVVDDLDAAVAFFVELGMRLEGQAEIEGPWADDTVGLDGIRCDIAMLRTPDGHGRLELSRYHNPAVIPATPVHPPHNTLGLHRVMFAVDDIDDTIARLRRHGAELLGRVARYEDSYRLCYLRGPAGIILALAEQLG